MLPNLITLQPYLKGGDTSSNLDVEESNTNQNDGSWNDWLKPDEASSMQLIEKSARKSLSQTHKKWKGKHQVDDAFTE